MLKVFSVYDSKAEAFMSPIYFPTKGAAIRAFGEAAKDEKSLIAKYPGDYSLFALGEFDEATGLFRLGAAPENLGTALSFVKE